MEPGLPAAVACDRRRETGIPTVSVNWSRTSGNRFLISSARWALARGRPEVEAAAGKRLLEPARQGVAASQEETYAQITQA
jgi:hypothetical protein